jgi:putative nucleotidyltransferase with HDIG domain
MPEHIFNHSKAVGRIAMVIASHLPDKINIGLVEAGALLHDICKTDSIHTGQDHAWLGGRLLDILGCPELASIVRQHVRLESDELNEAMIVNYADKRVMHEEVVSLSMRFMDLINRYGKDEERQERISNLFAKSLENEKIIIKATGINVEKL